MDFGIQKIIKNKGSEFKYGMMDQNIKVNGKAIFLKEKEG